MIIAVLSPPNICCLLLTMILTELSIPYDLSKNLRHTKGEWYNKPFFKLLPWQETIIRNLFGIIKPNGYRQFTTAYVEIAKKQGKTEMGAALALYMLTADGERGAEIYSCAATEPRPA